VEKTSSFFVEGAPLQRMVQPGKSSSTQHPRDVIKLDLTVDCLLHHRVDDRAAEATPFRAVTRAALCSQSSS